MVPNGWENVLLGEVFDFRNGINADKSQYGQGVKFVNVMDVFGNHILTEPKIIGRISISDKKLDDNRLEYGDVLFNRTSETFNEIAMSAVYLDNADATFGGFVIRGRPLTNNLDPKYTVYAFQDSNFRKQVIELGQGAVRANIGQKDLVKVGLLVPPVQEQQKIAKILSTWDKAISTTECLIENSTQQKRALMQQLLTGKKRLFDESGQRFDGEWEEVKLGKIADVRDGTHDSPEFIDVGYPLITSKNLLSSGRLDLSNVKFISEEDYLQINKRSGVNDGDILFGMIGTIGNPVKVKSSNYAIKNVALIKETGGLLNGFLIYYLSSHDIDKQIHRLNAGGTQKFVALGVLRNLVIRLPTQQEQQKIATVLSNANKEIELLEQQLADLQQEKKALMQMLLTGKKRVVV